MVPSKAVAAVIAVFAAQTASAKPLRIDPRIVGGSEANQAAWPFIVSLQNPSGRHHCGGSLLSSSFVITAAHCTVGRIPSQIQVHAGSNDRTDSQATVVGVARIFIHPGYSQITLENDISILQLSQPVERSATIDYVELPERDEDPAPSTKVMVSGWGATEDPRPPPPELAGQIPGGQIPGGQFPGGQIPGGQIPGGQIPGGQFPGGQIPGGQFPGGQIPGGQIPGDPLPGDQIHGGQILGRQFPGGQIPGDQISGGQIPGVQIPGGQFPGPPSTSPQLLREVELTIMDRNQCNQAHQSYRPAQITQGMICAGVSGGGKDSCFGDSGGPLVEKGKKLVGIVSWGRYCGHPMAPAAYTKVSSYLDYISKVGGFGGGNQPSNDFDGSDNFLPGALPGAWPPA
ncbi:Peptidase S1/S6, chymotrypsin/Hap, partial [Metarhizium majus ARSEF 297]